MQYSYKYDFFGQSTLIISATEKDLDDGFHDALLAADFEFCSDERYDIGVYGLESMLAAHKRDLKKIKKALKLRFSGERLMLGLRALEIFAKKSPENSGLLSVVEEVRKKEFEIPNNLN